MDNYFFVLLVVINELKYQIKYATGDISYN